MVESIREREVLYKLIISQLRYDGLDMVAANLAKCVGLETTPLSPSSRLLGLMKLGLQEEKNGIVPDMDTPPGLAPPIPPARGLDLEYEIEGSVTVEKENSPSDSNNTIVEGNNPGVLRNLPVNDIVPGNAIVQSLPGIANVTEQTVEENPAKKTYNDDMDLNAQPTMIACKEDIQIEGQVLNEDCSVSFILENEPEILSRESSNNCTNEDNSSKDEAIGQAEETMDVTLSNIVDLNPKNKGKLTDKSRYSVDFISEAFKPYREQLRFMDFKDLVSTEVINFGINQSIFSRTVLKRSQGYLSDLLNHQEAIMNMEEPSRMFTNFMKIKDFMDLDESERRCRYINCVKEAEAEKQRIESIKQPRVAQRKKRMSFSKDVKEGLRMVFKDRLSMPDQSELLQISEQFGLEISTVKNFFRNFKARSKISEVNMPR